METKKGEVSKSNRTLLCAAYHSRQSERCTHPAVSFELDTDGNVSLVVGKDCKTGCLSSYLPRSFTS
jgi:hypothetical protein